MQKTQPSFWLGRVYKTWKCVQDKNIRITIVFIIKGNAIVCMYLEFAYPRDPHPCGDLFVYLCKSVSVYLCICVFVFLCFFVIVYLCICEFASLTQGILILVAMLISWQAFDKSIWWLAHLVMIFFIWISILNSNSQGFVMLFMQVLERVC